jgi:hypothetical protein
MPANPKEIKAKRKKRMDFRILFTFTSSRRLMKKFAQQKSCPVNKQNGQENVGEA